MLGTGLLRRPDGAVYALDRAGVFTEIYALLLGALASHAFEVGTYGRENPDEISDLRLHGVTIRANAARDEYALHFGAGGS